MSAKEIAEKIEQAISVLDNGSDWFFSRNLTAFQREANPKSMATLLADYRRQSELVEEAHQLLKHVYMPGYDTKISALLAKLEAGR